MPDRYPTIDRCASELLLKNALIFGIDFIQFKGWSASKEYRPGISAMESTGVSTMSDVPDDQGIPEALKHSSVLITSGGTSPSLVRLAW
jgi:hypothetical protein